SITSVAFSPDGNHIVSGSGEKIIEVLKIQTDNEGFHLFDHTSMPPLNPCSNNTVSSLIPFTGFTNDSIMQNGWIVNPPSEYLFWVPPWNQTGLYWPRTKLVIGGTPTKIDFSRFKCGPSWEQCKDPIT
ncbi:hypothetical protein BD410DRAFT_724269, partial [Rickenella mellea]